MKLYYYPVCSTCKKALKWLDGNEFKYEKENIVDANLTRREIEFNKLISKTRYKVERTFGTIKKQFGGGIARYIGLEKMHTQHLMQAIAYNLYRSPGIIMSCCEKQTVK